MKKNFHQFDGERYELIFIDDGSTDNSLELLKREFPFSKVFHQENQGSGIARNLGVEKANGEYIAFSDVDDYLRREVLEDLVDTNYDVEIIQAVVKRCFHNKMKIKTREKTWKPSMFEMGDVIVSPSSFQKVYLDTIVMSKVFKSAFLKESGVKFPAGKYEDKHFLYYLYKLEPKIAVVNKYLYEWNVFKNSNSQTNVRDIDDLHQRFGVGFEIVDQEVENKSFLVANFINHDFTIYSRNFNKYSDDFKRVLFSYVQKLNDYQVESFRLSAKGKLVRAKSYEQFVSNYKKMNTVVNAKLGLQYGVCKVLNVPISSLKQKEHWVFMDRINKASDNAEALYNYVKKNGLKEDIFFVVDKKSKDFSRLKSKGFNVLAYGSLEHYKKQFTAKYFITSHIDNEVLFPWKARKLNIKAPRYELIFLQHGITRSDLSNWFNTKKIKMLCTSTEEEYSRVTKSGRYIIPKDGVKLTGLARHDLLTKDAMSEKVLVFPTWRSFLRGSLEAEKSEFAENWSNLLKELSELEHIQFCFILHPSINNLLGYFSDLIGKMNNVEMVNYFEIENFSELINNHGMLITDYSSVSFDFLYTRKPVVYYKFDEKDVHFTNSRPEYDLYNNCGYLLETEKEIREKVNSIHATDFAVEIEKVSFINMLFTYDDQNNCERIYREIGELDKG